MLWISLMLPNSLCTGIHRLEIISAMQHLWSQFVTGFAKTHHICAQCFSLPYDSYINKLTNYHNSTAKRWLVCFFWGLFLSAVRHPWGLGCTVNASGRLVEAATLLKITTWFVHDVGHRLIYNLWYLSAMEPHSRLFHFENCSALL